MPRGVYARKKKSNGHAEPKAHRKAPGKVAKLLATMRAEHSRAQDTVVALGTAIEALEVLENG